MKKFAVLIIMILVLVGCGKKVETNTNINSNKNNSVPQEELFMIGTTVDDGRVVNFTFSVPYKSGSLDMALLSNEISIEDFLKKLEYVDSLRDGGSKIYKYDRKKKEFGVEDFYVVSCNSSDNIKDVYVAKYKESLEGKCSLKIDDIEGISMSIKTFGKTGATVVITDNTDRENMYGESYALQKKENGVWVDMKPLHEMAFTSIGYSIGNGGSREFTINWEYHYGTLTTGTYRILKDFSYAGEGTNHYVTAEFEIK